MIKLQNYFSVRPCQIFLSLLGPNKYGSRILNGEIIMPHSKPYLVDVSGACTGSILGKRHILSVAHCFIDGLVIDAYNKRKYFYVGTHQKQDSSTGQRLERSSIVGITKDGHPVDFPINTALYSLDTNLIDIALITFDTDIAFTENIKKVRLEDPKDPYDDCRLCSGDCDPSNIFKAYGWGRHELGIRNSFL